VPNANTKMPSKTERRRWRLQRRMLRRDQEAERVASSNPQPSSESPEMEDETPEAGTKTAPKQTSKVPESKEPQRILLFTRSTLVLSLVIGVLRAMQIISPYSWTVAQIYVLSLLTEAEVLIDPPLRKVRWILTAVVAGFVIWFSVAVVVPKAPLDALAYVLPVDSKSRTVISGIPWDPHLTDLRVSLTNLSGDEYRDLDVLLEPDHWVYKAAIEPDAPSECQLIPNEGMDTIKATVNVKAGISSVTMVPDGLGSDIYDSAGDLLLTIASGNGYRLRCSTFPARSTVHMVLALVGKVRPEFSRVAPPRDEQPRFSIMHVRGLEKALDIFGVKPSPKTIRVGGKYFKGIKPYLIPKKIINIDSTKTRL